MQYDFPLFLISGASFKLAPNQMNTLLQQNDFKALFDNTLDAIMVADDNGFYIAANPAACDLLRVPESFIVGRHISEFLTPDREAIFREKWPVFLEQGQLSGEIELVRPDGTHCLTEYRSKAHFRPGQHLSVMRDITDRKHTELALVELNRQIVSIMESVSDAVFAFDKEWRFLYANPQSEPILGCPRQEVIGKNLWEIYPQALGTVFEEEYQRAAREKCSVHFQGYIGTAKAWVEVHVYPSDVGVTVYVRDINDRKRAEEDLQFLADAGAVLSSSLEHDHIIQNLADLAISYLADWCAIEVLEGREIKRLAVVHKDPAKIEFAKQYQQLHPAHIDDPFGVPRILRTGQSLLAEEINDEGLARFAKDAQQLEMLRQLGLRSVILVPLLARGQTIGVVSLVREKNRQPFLPSDLVVAEEFARRAGSAIENGRLFREMTNALRTAQEASRARDEFLAIVSHELKTPMTPILGWISLLKSQDHPTDMEMVNHALEVIERNALAQAQLVNDLLDISRIVTGKLQLNIKEFDLALVVGYAVETLRPAAQAKGIELKLRLEEPVIPLLADSDRLQQVVWNLISNAIKFTPQDGQVEVSLQRVRSTVQLQVKDSGLGLDEEFLPYIFDRFRQADSSSTRKHGGLGLGLSIVRNLVDLHGGTVKAESPGLGQGSTFTVCLPNRASVPETPPSLTEIPAHEEEAPTGLLSANTPPVLSGLRLLVIEDMKDSRDMVMALLERQGAEVRGASGASEGFDLLQEWHPDVVLCDIGMPQEDGYSFIQRVRALPSERGGTTPAIALTAYGRLEDRLHALSHGFQQHVAKPVTSAELIVTIASLVGRQLS